MKKEATAPMQPYLYLVEGKKSYKFRTDKILRHEKKYQDKDFLSADFIYEYLSRFSSLALHVSLQMSKTCFRLSLFFLKIYTSTLT